MSTKQRSKKRLETKTLVAASLLTALSIIFTRFFAVMIPLAGLPALRFGFGEIPLMLSGIILGPLAGGLSGAVADLLGVLINSQGAFFPGFTLSSILWGVIPGLLYKIFRTRNFRINFNIINGLIIIVLAGGVLSVLYTNNVLKLQDGAIYLYDRPLSILLIILFALIILGFIIIPVIASREDRERKNIYSLDKIMFTSSLTYIIISLGLNTLWLSIMFNQGFIAFLPGRILAGLIAIPLNASIIYIISRRFKI